MAGGLAPLQGRFWRLLSIRWQGEPHGSGAHLTGGRWNPPGMRALYLGADHATAIAEYLQSLVHPGTLAAYDIEAGAIADLRDPAVRAAFDIAEAVPHCEWRSLYAIERREPPTWPAAARLIAAGAVGALVPSVQFAGGTNLVLWRWSADGGDGARVTVVDPHGELRRPR